MRWLVRGAFAAALLLVAVAHSSAQPRETRMLITVIDQTNAVIPGATVTCSTEPATQKRVSSGSDNAERSGDHHRLTPGRLPRAQSFRVLPGVLKEVRVRQGDTPHHRAAR